MLLSDKYPFLTDYFTKMASSENHAYPQSILFYGNDFEAQYTLAKEIARLLNCKEDKSDKCTCLNCKWINENTHPAVMTISKSDNKPEDDDSKTVISVKQTALIKEKIINSSDFYRVFIFCDRDESGNISGLNKDNFQAESANSLLKIIEEPQPNILFIFLARYIDDLLPTIVSRSQCFFVPEKNPDLNYDYSLIEGVFDNYWSFERKDTFEISQNLQNLTKNSDVLSILDAIQNYVLSMLKINPERKDFINHIKIIEYAKKQSKLGIKTANIFDDVCLKLIK